MKWVLIIATAILVFILLISIMKLKIKIDILHTGDNDHIKIKAMALFGLISYTYDVPFIKINKDNPSLIVKTEQKVGNDNKTPNSKDEKQITPNDVMDKIKQAKEFLEHVIHLHKIVKKFMSHISIEKLEWNSSLGLGDAAQTGVAIGVLWSLKGGIVGLLSQYMQLKSQPVLTVNPHFQEILTHTSLTCIFSFRIGHAIGGALRVVKYWKNTKGGKQHVRTSDSRLDDNSYGKLEAND